MTTTSSPPTPPCSLSGTTGRDLPGAADQLRWCAASGLSVVMATSGSAKDLEALMARLDADDAVTATTTSADAEHSKPDTDLLEVALRRAGAEATEAVFVGDAVWDMIAARRMGMRCIGLECGGVSEAELREAGASEVWQDPDDVLANVNASALTGP
jgi:phosphoglycolate phosphatase-like HAD superfamily hydrolase